jgi:hypothetical protein
MEESHSQLLPNEPYTHYSLQALMFWRVLVSEIGDKQGELLAREVTTVGT